MSYEGESRDRDRDRNRGRRRRKKRRVRYDRIIGVAAIFIVLLIIFVSCCKSCGGGSDSDESSVVPTMSSEEKNKENGVSGGSDENDSGDNGELDNELNEISSYTNISAMPNEMFSGDLILVNKEHEYSFPPTEEEADIIPVYEKSSDSYKFQDYEVSLSTKTILALNNLMDAFYAKTGKNDIMVITGYRTKERQNELDNGVMGGFSELHTGMSFIIGIFPDGGNSYLYIPEGEYEWINSNCAKYGFILRYPEGKEDITGFPEDTSQFRYVGVPHAVYMAENNICLEEYIDELKDYLCEDEHLKISVDNKKYEVYYVPADPSANTNIPVPEGKTYEVSGNNIDGFIVTVEI